MLRDTFNLPYGTHRYILRHLSQKRSLKKEFYSRFKKFCLHVQQSRKEEVLYLYKIQRYDSRSIFGSNYRNVIGQPKDITQPYRIDAENEWKLKYIDELISVKSNIKVIPGFSYDDCDNMLQQLCCS